MDIERKKKRRLVNNKSVIRKQGKSNLTLFCQYKNVRKKIPQINNYPTILISNIINFKRK